MLTIPGRCPNDVELAVRLTPDTEQLATAFQIVGEHLAAAGTTFTACASEVFKLIDNPKA